MSGTGRAQRTRLEHRLTTARHGAKLLDRKQHIVAEELERLQLRAGLVRAQWEDLAAEAARWLGRAAALDGLARITSAAPQGRAEVLVHRETAMGVDYPADAHCRCPLTLQDTGSSALIRAAAAHRAALEAAVRYAAAQRAVRLLTAELTATRSRRRAVENRWIPQLEQQLLEVARQIEAQELEETLRLRWAADRRPRNRGPTAPTPDRTETA